MDKKEVEVIARIMLKADGGCMHCGLNLIDLMVEKFPKHRATIEAIVSKKWGYVIGGG